MGSGKDVHAGTVGGLSPAQSGIVKRTRNGRPQFACSGPVDPLSFSSLVSVHSRP